VEVDDLVATLSVDADRQRVELVQVRAHWLLVEVARTMIAVRLVEELGTWLAKSRVAAD
jgi:hypothetical protein